MITIDYKTFKVTFSFSFQTDQAAKSRPGDHPREREPAGQRLGRLLLSLLQEASGWICQQRIQAGIGTGSTWIPKAKGNFEKKIS